MKSSWQVTVVEPEQPLPRSVDADVAVRPAGSWTVRTRLDPLAPFAELTLSA